MSVSKRKRFEIFKRDGFKCQYCGRSSPEVILHADHIHPASKGGKDDLLNLITSCSDCNLGKSDKTLDDNTMLAKQRQQLEELSERREQLKMMLKWREGLADIESDATKAAIDHWNKAVAPWNLNAKGEADIGDLVKQHGLSEVLDAIDGAVKGLGVCDVSQKEINKVFGKVGAILTVNKRSKGDPNLKRLYYIRGIVRNRGYCNAWQCMDLLKEGLNAGLTVDAMEEIAKTSRNWTNWNECMDHEISIAIQGGE